MIWIKRPNKLAATLRPGESCTDSMISIPITDEASEALRREIPGSIRTRRPEAETVSCGYGLNGRSSTSF